MAFSEIDDLVNAQGQTLGQHISQAENFIQQLSTLTAVDLIPNSDPLASRVTNLTLGVNTPDMLAALIANKPVKPATLDYVSPADPGSPPGDFDIRDGFTVTLPDFAVQPPTLTIPQPPTIDDLPAAPSTPTIDSVTKPAPPTVTLPDVPELTQIVFPDSPGFFIPLFTEKFPETPELILETNDFEFVDELYQNDVLDALHNTLLADINNGEFGITPDDEEALYERFKDREYAQARGNEKEIIRQMSVKGFTLPPGQLYALLESDLERSARAVSDANREVTINRAELLRRAREFAIQQGLSYNELLLRDFGFRQERALNASRFAAEYKINILDAKIRRYNAQVQGFLAYAQAYEAQVRALLAQADIFKTEVEAALAKQEANKIEIDIYVAQVNALNTIVALYDSQLRAAQIEIEIERNKLQVYETQIRAFLGQIDAKRNEVALYGELLRGEQTRTEVYRSQVQAFSEQVRAAGIASEIQNQNIGTDIKKAQLELEGYDAKIRKYASDVQAELARVRSLTEIYSTDGSILNTVMNAWGSILSIDTKVLDSFLGQIQFDLQLAQERTKILLAEAESEASIRLSAAQSGAAVYEALLASAAAGVSADALEYKDTSP